MIDSHCHLDRLELGERSLASALDEARAVGVDHFLCIGVSLDSAGGPLAVAEAHGDVSASVGVHPLYHSDRVPSVAELVALADHPQVVALGETGLDYFKNDNDPGVQQQAFIHHLQAASQLGLPTIVHTRAAVDDTLAIMREYADPQHVGVLHCFTESWDMAEAALDLGWYISISGIVTFGNADALREVARRVPAERLLIETDSPWLAPKPHRGLKNEPKYLPWVLECVAAQRGVRPGALDEQTSENFYRLFTRAAVR
ncbi:YchF/TatD family DNA exonuclease [Litorivicinus lipolyticus]|uniref:YchF/TatD family DNA exonuclease n=1 Tax=Litorivicinus lipolyticus TaxID=418701 RepID=A0A5Q2Q7D2_9GAMM|nr:TatD family hydrolase [Litorivicinus lipolyticus]QGG79848.1 YchF/TatD family DNA exonuclease [Litorivicinus lipolyticus]